jgi:xanthine/uracil permease
MTLDDTMIQCTNFFYTYPYIIIAIIAVLGIIIYLKPKEVFKTTLILLGLIVACYIIYLIGDATVTGVFNKEKMIHH